ncbi:hypothetical protein HOY80DRAFT_866056, partial [Tuber brumale]
DIGFFGESLQKEFLVGLGIVEEVDLVVVMWSSLRVHPPAMFPRGPKEELLRILF